MLFNDLNAQFIFFLLLSCAKHFIRTANVQLCFITLPFSLPTQKIRAQPSNVLSTLNAL